MIWRDPRDVALVAEVASPSTQQYDATDKLASYARARVPSHWRIEQIAKRRTAPRTSTSALIAVERQDRERVSDLLRLKRAGTALVTHPLVVAQVWHSPPGRQTEPSRFLKGVDVRSVDGRFGRQCELPRPALAQLSSSVTYGYWLSLESVVVDSCL